MFKEAFDGKSYMELYRKDQVSVRKNSMKSRCNTESRVAVPDVRLYLDLYKRNIESMR